MFFVRWTEPFEREMHSPPNEEAYQLFKFSVYITFLFFFVLERQVIMDLQAMYALLCEVQQASVMEESQLKQFKAEVQHLRDKNTTLRASVAAAHTMLQDTESHLKHALQERSIATAKHSAALDGCNHLRHALMTAANDDEEAVMQEAIAGWRQVSAAVSLRLTPKTLPSPKTLHSDVFPTECDRISLAHHEDQSMQCAPDPSSHSHTTDPSLAKNDNHSKFVIRRGPTTNAKKTMFVFR